MGNSKSLVIIGIKVHLTRLRTQDFVDIDVPKNISPEWKFDPYSGLPIHTKESKFTWISKDLQTIYENKMKISGIGLYQDLDDYLYIGKIYETNSSMTIDPSEFFPEKVYEIREIISRIVPTLSITEYPFCIHLVSKVH